MFYVELKVCSFFNDPYLDIQLKTFSILELLLIFFPNFIYEFEILQGTEHTINRSKLVSLLFERNRVIFWNLWFYYIYILLFYFNLLHPNLCTFQMPCEPFQNQGLNSKHLDPCWWTHITFIIYTHEIVMIVVVVFVLLFLLFYFISLLVCVCVFVAMPFDTTSTKMFTLQG